MRFSIRRDESPDAFDCAAAVHTACFPDEPPMAGGDLQQLFVTARAEGEVAALWLAEVDGDVVGAGALRDLLGLDAALLSVMVNVLAGHRGRGIGRALHEAVLVRSAAARPGLLLSMVYERDPRALRFATAAGYTETSTARRSELDLTGFDPDLHRGALDRALASGIEFTTVGAMRERHSDWFERLYTLCYELEDDIPFPVPQRHHSREAFREAVVESPGRLDGFHVAVEGDRWIGLTELRTVPDDPTALHQELTGVVADARRRGIATALKVHALGLAKGRGYLSAQTWNDTANPGMIAINDALGFADGVGTALMTRPI